MASAVRKLLQGNAAPPARATTPAPTQAPPFVPRALAAAPTQVLPPHMQPSAPGPAQDPYAIAFNGIVAAIQAGDTTAAVRGGLFMHGFVLP